MRENEIKRDLRSLSQLLSNWDKNVKNPNVLNNDLVFTPGGGNINYSLERSTPLIFKDIDLERHSIPSGIENLNSNEKDFEVHLNILLSEVTSDDDPNFDPILRLGVAIKVKGDYIKADSLKSVICSWHLDRDSTATSGYSHPTYHLNFGGDHMTSFAIAEDGYFGNLLLLPNPRIIHPPMDLILSCDFIIKNFYKKSRHQKITDLPAYKTLVDRASKRYWASFANAFASKWNNDLIVKNLSHNNVIGNH